MRIKSVELFLALGLATTTVACGQKEPSPAGGAAPQGNMTAPAGQPAPANAGAKEGGEEGEEKNHDKKQEEGGEGGEGT